MTSNAEITLTELADGLAVRELMIAYLRYQDIFGTVDGMSMFAERNLCVDSTDTRPSHR